MDGKTVDGDIPKGWRRRRAGSYEPSWVERYSRWPDALVGGNRVSVLHNGIEAFPAIKAAIAAARQYVHIEMYTIMPDVVGWDMVEAMGEAARRGVRVRVLYDSAGCLRGDVTLFDKLERSGVEAVEVRPVAPWRPRWSWNNRHHRKTVVVDGQVGFAAGLNFAAEYGYEPDGSARWRDCAMRIEGPAVRRMNEAFSVSWRAHAPAALLHDARFLDAVRPEGARRQRARLRDGSGQAQEVPAPVAVEVLPTGEGYPKGAIHEAYAFAISRAQKSAYIACAYFVPGAALRRAMVRAVRRGVDVRVLLPSEQGMDIPAVYWASRRLFGRLLRAGVRLFEWQGQMMHAKTAVIDSLWVVVGSANLDPRSRFHNNELNLTATDPTVGDAMHRRFLADLRRAVELDVMTWGRRSWVGRLIERVAWWFRYWL